MKKGQSVVFTAKATTATPSNRPRSWLESLPDDFKSELVQARERGQVRAGEGSVRHVAPIDHPRHEQVSSRLPSRLVSWRQRQNSVSCSARALPWL